MVNKGNVQGMYHAECLWYRVGLAILPYPFRFFFLEGRPHTIVWPTLCAGSYAPNTLLAPLLSSLCVLQPAVYMYAKYTTGSAYEIMASHDTNIVVCQIHYWQCLSNYGFPWYKLQQIKHNCHSTPVVQLGECKTFVGWTNTVSTIWRNKHAPVITHIVQLFLEMHAVLTLVEAFHLSFSYSVHLFYDMVMMKQKGLAMTWHDLSLCKTPSWLITQEH